jgi:hypothetical protein
MRLDWLNSFFVPRLFTILALLLYLSPYKDILHIRKNIQQLGAFNIAPYAWMIVSNVTWLAYESFMEAFSFLFVNGQD